MTDHAPLTVAQIGNFRHPWCSEVHFCQSLESLGHTVHRLQEDELDWARLPELAANAHLVMWTRTWATPSEVVLPALAQLREQRIPSVSAHLDRWWGLDREHQVTDDPFFRTDLVVSPDGGNADRWASAGVNHLYLPPGVYAAECGVVAVNPRAFPHEVVFVGTHPYPHAEWAGYRAELLTTLRKHFGARFGLYPRARGRPVRGKALQQLYATAKVVVGDSCLAGGATRYWCVDAATEVLTTAGWKRYDQVTDADTAYTMNPDTGLGEWQQIQAVTVHPAEPRTMWAMEGERHSSLTTLDHKWLVERHHSRRVAWSIDGPCPECGWVSHADDPRWGLAIHRAHLHGVRSGPPVKEVHRSRTFSPSRALLQGDRIPLAAPCADLPTDPKHHDAYVELVAWTWTEGSRGRDRYTGISQSHRANGPYVARIRAALTALCGPDHGPLVGSSEPAWTERREDSNHGMTTFALNASLGRLLWDASPGGVVTPAFVMSLTAAQLRLFVDTSVDGDGCRKTSTTRGCTSTSITLAQKDPARLDAFEMACALLGVATSRTLQGDIWLVHMKRRIFTAPLRKNQGVTAGPVEHHGIVWCPTTANGTWLARRRGTVYFTGNSDRIPETLGRGGLLIHPEVDGLADWYTDHTDLLTYEQGRFDQVLVLAEWALSNPDEARKIADHGRATVLGRDTYAHRMTAVLDHVEDTIGLGRGPLAQKAATTPTLPPAADPQPAAPTVLRVRHRRHRGLHAEFELAEGDPDNVAVWEVWQDDTYQVPIDHVRGQHVVDIGGNIGAFTVLAAKLGAAMVDTYEPIPRLAAICEQNAARNRVGDRVRVHTAAVGGTAGVAWMTDVAAGGAHLDVESGPGRLEVEVVSIGDVLAQAGGPVGLLKVDCEGGEFDIVEAVTPDELAQVRHIAMEFHGPGMPHLAHLLGAAEWGPMVAKLAEYGRVRTFGHPSRGGLIWVDGY